LFEVNVSKVQLPEEFVESSVLQGWVIRLVGCLKFPNSPAVRVSEQIPSGLPSSLKQDLPENWWDLAAGCAKSSSF
jgi:hypothetical protein